MPLTIREPQKGGVGTRLSTATSDRAGTSSSGRSSTCVADRTRRWRRSGNAAPGTPRFTAIAASINRSPSKASRAYVEQDLGNLFEGEVRYARDAFEGLRLMDAAMAVKRGVHQPQSFKGIPRVPDL